MAIVRELLQWLQKQIQCHCIFNRIFITYAIERPEPPSTLEITWPQHSHNNVYIIHYVDVNQTIIKLLLHNLGSIILWEINFHRHAVWLLVWSACEDRNQFLASPPCMRCKSLDHDRLSPSHYHSPWFSLIHLLFLFLYTTHIVVRATCIEFAPWYAHMP